MAWVGCHCGKRKEQPTIILLHSTLDGAQCPDISSADIQGLHFQYNLNMSKPQIQNPTNTLKLPEVKKDSKLGTRGLPSSELWSDSWKSVFTWRQPWSSRGTLDSGPQPPQCGSPVSLTPPATSVSFPHAAPDLTHPHVFVFLSTDEVLIMSVLLQ